MPRFVMSLLLLVAAPVGVLAQDADALLRRGVALRAQGQDAEAADVFQQAVEIEATPRALAQLALAEQALGRWVAAETHLSLALDASGDRWIRSRRRVLDEAMREIQSHLGSLEVECNEPATLRVGGDDYATLPLSEPIRLPTGEVEIEVVAGERSVRRTVRIRAGELVRESVRLPEVRAERPRDPPPSGGSDTAAILAFVGAGIFGAGAIGGAIWWIDRQSEVSFCAEADCRNSDELATFRTLAAATTITAAVLATAAAVAGVLLLDGDETPSDTAATCVPTLLGLTCRAAF